MNNGAGAYIKRRAKPKRGQYFSGALLSRTPASDRWLPASRANLSACSFAVRSCMGALVREVFRHRQLAVAQPLFLLLQGVELDQTSQGIRAQRRNSVWRVLGCPKIATLLGQVVQPLIVALCAAMPDHRHSHSTAHGGRDTVHVAILRSSATGTTTMPQPSRIPHIMSSAIISR